MSFLCSLCLLLYICNMDTWMYLFGEKTNLYIFCHPLIICACNNWGIFHKQRDKPKQSCFPVCDIWACSFLLLTLTVWSSLCSAGADRTAGCHSAYFYWCGGRTVSFRPSAMPPRFQGTLFFYYFYFLFFFWKINTCMLVHASHSHYQPSCL